MKQRQSDMRKFVFLYMFVGTAGFFAFGLLQEDHTRMAMAAGVAFMNNLLYSK